MKKTGRSDSISKRIVLWLILKYKKKSIRFKRICLFYPSCSSYAYFCFKRQKFLIAVWRSLVHIVKCNPLYRGSRVIIPAKQMGQKDFVLKDGRYKILKKDQKKGF